MKADLDKCLQSKVGTESRMVVLTNDDETCNTAFIISDGIRLCQENNVRDALLLLLATYYLLNLTYPKKYEQLLGFIQLVCLEQDFPIQQRSSGFTKLKESL
jgi:hypothetical protein